jgi:ADP-ribose pyrophosphatase YjhB (NUDIX family)
MRRRLLTPYLAVDIIIEFGGGIVLIERRNFPTGWAIPGGFVEVGETLESAARREAKEETSLDVELLEQFYAYSDPKRDPRFHVVSVVFIAKGEGSLRGRDDARRACVFKEQELPADIAFDHRNILYDYFRYKKTGQRPRLIP